MSKKWIAALVWVLLFTSLTGCWNRRELDDLAIVSGLGIDKVGDQYLFAAQVVNPGQISPAGDGGDGRAPVVMFRVRANTVFEGFRRMTLEAPRKLYVGHIQMLILGEKVAKEGITNVLDFFVRDHEVRTDYYLVVARGARADRVLDILLPIEKIPAHKMLRSLESSAGAWGGPTVKVQLDQLVNELISKGKNPVLSGIGIRGDYEKGFTSENVQTSRPTQVEYMGSTLFKGDRLVGWFDEEESKGYNYALGEIMSTVEYVTTDKGEKITVELIRTNSELQTNVVDGKPQGEVLVRVRCNIGEADGNIDLTDPKTIDSLEEGFEEEIRTMILKALRKAKGLRTDVFGFGDVLHRSNPDYWSKVEKKWGSVFAEMPIRVRVKIDIKQLGTSVQSLKKEMGE
ncbi:Ger(x)C family spore germination protein [Desmospora profundinema]|uniref:Spore germination protein KC n=1 Tax=Desmospora profundinema TaxID=1571184 RepID=A0ABU1IHX6_9BACL|nr:Ger(x)C family spore germination protein [Desmospora profundinema]MDR6224372.1 spore germination protein KC [Desmospora profundinema]